MSARLNDLFLQQALDRQRKNKTSKRKTAARKPVECWAVVDVDGSFLAGPSSSRTEVEKEAAWRWGDHAFKATRFVPAEARELKRLRRIERAAHEMVAHHGAGDLGEEQAIAALEAAVRLKRGGA